MDSDTIIGKIAFGGGGYGQQNVIIGDNAAIAPVAAADYNVVIGGGSPGYALDGDRNVLMGYSAGYIAQTMFDCISIGPYSGGTWSGKSNTFVGAWSGNVSGGSTNAATLGANVMPHGNDTVALGRPTSTVYVDGSLILSNNFTFGSNSVLQQSGVINGTNAVRFTLAGTNFWILLP
jgi:hypothetical protein